MGEEISKRKPVLDYIRVIATFMVVIYHFDIEFRVKIGPFFPYSITSFYNLNLGGIGVFLFFLLSGDALYHKYAISMNVRDFYKKRFLAIYPMFWLTYIVALLIEILLFNPSFINVAKGWKIMLTVMGMDGYFSCLNPSFYLVGEWFTTVIVMIYILFPMIRLFIKKNYWLSFYILLFLDVYIISRGKDFIGIVPDGSLVMALTVFLFGARIRDMVTEGVFLRIIVIGIIVLMILFAKVVPSVILNSLISICLYTFVNSFEKNIGSSQLIAKLANCSYGIYLTHHYVIRKVFLYNFFNKWCYLLLSVIGTALLLMLVMAMKKAVECLNERIKEILL